MTLQAWVRKPGWVAAVRWYVSGPFRLLAATRALPRGRGFFSRLAWRIAWSTVMPGSTVVALTPGGCSVAFRAETLMGRALWTKGEFERSELAAAFRLSAPDTYAFDVGANVGLFSVVMSQAVGPGGRVVAIEPVARTAQELRWNLEQNHCANVDVIEGAAAASSGVVPLILTDDPALHTAGGELIAGHVAIRVTNVKAYTLDELWIAAGRPPVSLVKIDVEGGEQGVLRGATQMIGMCRPAVIIEVNDPRHVARVVELVPGYHAEPAGDFEPWNHLLTPK